MALTNAHAPVNLTEVLQRLAGLFDSPQAALAWYWLPAILSYILLVGMVLAHFLKAESRQGAPTFAILLAVTILLFRWPMFALTERNPDESQLLAGGLTLGYDPAFWRSVDGGTHGPLLDFALLVLPLLGLKIQYASARLLAWAMMIGSARMLYATLRGLYNDRTARLAVLPLVLCLCFCSHRDFVAYNAEVPTIWLLTIGLFLASRLAWAQDRLPFGALCAGLVLGAIPYAKLQGAPVAVVLALWGYFNCYRKGSLSSAGALTAGLVAPTIITIALTLYAGTFTDFRHSYLGGNVIYATRAGGLASYTTGLAKLQGLAGFAFTIPEAAQYFSTLILAIVGCLLGLAVVNPWDRVSQEAVAPIVLALAVAGAALYSVTQAGHSFYHYLLLLFVPAGLLAGTALGALLSSLKTRSAQLTVAGLFLLVTVVYPFATGVARGDEVIRMIAASRHEQNREAVAAILAHARPDDSLVVWGWDARYYALTGLRQGVRDAVTTGVITADTTLYREPGTRFLQRFLSDLARNRPPLFVDAVGIGAFAFDNRERFAHECYSEVDEYVSRHYRLVADANGARIYVALDRLPH